MKKYSREHQIFLVEKLRRLNEELTGLMQARPDILHIANNTMNNMILLQEAIMDDSSGVKNE